MEVSAYHFANTTPAPNQPQRNDANNSRHGALPLNHMYGERLRNDRTSGIEHAPRTERDLRAHAERREGVRAGGKRGVGALPAAPVSAVAAPIQEIAAYVRRALHGSGVRMFTTCIGLFIK